MVSYSGDGDEGTYRSGDGGGVPVIHITGIAFFQPFHPSGVTLTSLEGTPTGIRMGYGWGWLGWVLWF